MDVSTGRVFTISKTDLFLPGLFNLSLIRSYSSDRRDIDVGIGFGWTHSLAWTLEERRASVIVRTGDGQRVERIVGPAAPQPATGVAAPAWVGRSPPGALERRFDYTPVDEVCKVTSSDGEDIEYTYRWSTM